MLLVKTKIDKSRIHGIGLFAAERIPEGTIIWELNPVIDLRLTVEQISQLPISCQEQMKAYTYREKSSGLYVLCGDDARFFNHASNPNCLDTHNVINGDLTIARRDISPGEELTCNYASFDLDMAEGKYDL